MPILGQNKNTIIRYPLVQSSELTEADFNDRKGFFTGSSIGKLMTKTSRAGSWSSYTQNMICDFGKTALDYIFSKIRERQTGRVIRMKQTAEMRYGSRNEHHIFEPLKAEYIEEGIYLENCKFIPHPKIKAGATPDGFGFKIGDVTKSPTIAVEIKCCLTDGTLLHRCETANTEQNCDFWQHQLEMMVLGVDKLVYGCGHPPKTYDDPPSGYEKMIVYASDIHQQAIINRVNLADKIANDFITNNRKIQEFKQSVLQSISEFNCSTDPQKPIETPIITDKPQKKDSFGFDDLSW